jgi:hypothetical protein
MATKGLQPGKQMDGRPDWYAWEFVNGNKTWPFLLKHLKRHRLTFKNSFPRIHPAPFSSREIVVTVEY